MESDFVNRKSEFIFINDWINTPAKKNKGVFMYAKSGIGKSRFVSEFFNSELPDHIKIKVDMLGTDTSSIGSYSFLMRLYRKVIVETEKMGSCLFCTGYLLPLVCRLDTLQKLIFPSHLLTNTDMQNRLAKSCRT